MSLVLALEHFEINHSTYSLVITDLRMPDMSCFEFSKMDLACPNCQTIFVPQMRTQLTGSNTRGMYVFVYVFVYYQLCPNCKESIVGVKEQNDLL
jgi:hypothetical protein